MGIGTSRTQHIAFEKEADFLQAKLPAQILDATAADNEHVAMVEKNFRGNPPEDMTFVVVGTRSR